jgi:hypothetical protein
LIVTAAGLYSWLLTTSGIPQKIIGEIHAAGGRADRHAHTCGEGGARARVADHHMTELIDRNRRLMKINIGVVDQSGLNNGVSGFVDFVPAQGRVRAGSLNGVNGPHAGAHDDGIGNESRRDVFDRLDSVAGITVVRLARVRRVQ